MSFRVTPAPLDWASLKAWAAAQGRALDPGDPPRQFAGGLANLNYLVTLDAMPAVLRCPPPGPLAHGASDMAREARVLERLHPVFPLAPRLLAFTDDATVIGRPFQLLEWRPGIAIGGTLPAGLTSADADWLLPALAGTLAALHALDPESEGLAGLGRPSGFAERQLAGWTKRASAAFADDATPALAELLARLGAAVPPDPPVKLLHMDAKFDNLLVDPGTCAATALIDWDMGTLGPPAFDLAVLLSYWIEPGDPTGVQPLAAVPSLAPGWPGRAAVIEAYARAAGSVPPDLGWHLGLARLRLATAWMQLYRLWEQGRLEGAGYSGFVSLADAILTQAVEQFGELP